MVVGRAVIRADVVDGVEELIDAVASQHFSVGVSTGQVKTALTEGSCASDDRSVGQTELRGI